MAQPFITNKILIASPPADVWDTLTDPERTRIYMYGCETVSLWKVGSSLEWEMFRDGERIVVVKGEILEFVPDEKLVYTVIDPNNEDLPDVPENYLTVTYELKKLPEGTELTVTQGDYTKVAMGEERYEQTYNNGEGWNPILEQIKEISEEAYKEWVIKNPPKKEGEGKKKKKKGRGSDRRDGGREGGRERREGRREGGENRGGGQGGENQPAREGGERRQGEGRNRDNRGRGGDNRNRGDRKPREQGAEGQERKPREQGAEGQQERKPREGGEGQQQGQGGERRQGEGRNRDNRGRNRDNRNRDRNRENRGPREQGGEGQERRPREGGENQPPRNDAPPPSAE